MGTDFYSVPTNATIRQIQPRNIFSANDAAFDPSSLAFLISGSKSRDTGSSPVSLLRAGLILGKITAAGTELGKYAPSILGVVAAAIGGGQTSITVPAAVATELVRRVGATGTFNLTGAAASGGTARTKTATYSAVNTTTGAITITALATAAVSAVNAVEALPVVDSTGSGTFTLTIEGVTTAAITYSATIATLITNINNALNASFGTSAIVASGASLAALILTFSGTGYAGRPINTSTNGTVTANVIATLITAATGFTIGNNPTSSGVGAALAGGSTVTTVGVVAVAADIGNFVAGSIVQPTDGSQNPVFILSGGYSGDWYGLDVVSNSSGASIDQVIPAFLVRGSLKSTKIVNFTADDFGNNVDASVQTWIKSQFATNNRVYTYSANY